MDDPLQGASPVHWVKTLANQQFFGALVHYQVETAGAQQPLHVFQLEIDDLQQISSILGKDKDKTENVTRMLEHMLKNRDLAGLRDPKAVAKLPKDEAESWQSLWKNVASLLEKARQGRDR